MSGPVGNWLGQVLAVSVAQGCACGYRIWAEFMGFNHVQSCSICYRCIEIHWDPLEPKAVGESSQNEPWGFCCSCKLPGGVQWAEWPPVDLRCHFLPLHQCQLEFLTWCLWHPDIGSSEERADVFVSFCLSCKMSFAFLCYRLTRLQRSCHISAAKLLERKHLLYLGKILCCNPNIPKPPASTSVSLSHGTHAAAFRYLRRIGRPRKEWIAETFSLALPFSGKVQTLSLARKNSGGADPFWANEAHFGPASQAATPLFSNCRF